MPAASFWPLPDTLIGLSVDTFAPEIAEDDYLFSLQSLLPPGRAWTRDPNAVLTGFLRGLAVGWNRIHERALALLVDAFPATTNELLPEWEATLGLPDPCAGPQPLLSVRLQQVMARLQFLGGQSIPYYTAYAKALGYDITIDEFAPFRVGMPVGLPIIGDAWAHAWQVNAAGFTIHYFQVGVDVVGNPLASWTNTILECELQRIKPGHTILFFRYVYVPAMGPGPWLFADDGVTLLTDDRGNPMIAV